MAHYYNLTITRRIKVQDPLPDDCSIETKVKKEFDLL